MQLKSKLLLIISGTSLLVVIGAAVALSRLAKTGSVLSLSHAAKTGTLYFEGTQKVAVNQQFSVKVMIDTNEQNVNAGGIYVRFDPEKIQVNEMKTENSFCQFYPEKKFDNRLGLISLACGAPHPGFKGKSEFIELVLTPLSIGTTVLHTTGTSKLLLSDGKGSNILTSYPSWEVQISAGL